MVGSGANPCQPYAPCAVDHVSRCQRRNTVCTSGQRQNTVWCILCQLLSCKRKVCALQVAPGCVPTRDTAGTSDQQQAHRVLSGSAPPFNLTYLCLPNGTRYHTPSSLRWSPNPHASRGLCPPALCVLRPSAALCGAGARCSVSPRCAWPAANQHQQSLLPPCGHVTPDHTPRSTD